MGRVPDVLAAIERSGFSLIGRFTRNGLIFDNSFNIEGVRLKSLMENGYEEGCTRGTGRLKCQHPPLEVFPKELISASNNGIPVPVMFFLFLTHNRSITSEGAWTTLNPVSQ
jgi:hypothetical protein